MVLSISVAAVMFTATATSSEEATLKVESVVRNSSGAVTSTSTIESLSGTYEHMLAKLSSIAPDAERRYTITLKSDAVQSTPVAIEANSNSEIRIELGGNKLTYNASGAAITLSGDGAQIRINGGYNRLGEYGSIVSTAESAPVVKIESGSFAKADLKNLDITYAGDTLFLAEGGEATIRESYVSYIGEAESAVVKAIGATACLKYVDINGTGALTALELSGAKGYIEGGSILAGAVVSSDESKSDVALISVNIDAVAALEVGSSETITYVLGGKINVSEALASGNVSASNLAFYYGDGDMTVYGDDPTVYGIQPECSFEKVDDTYVMSTSSTSTAMTTTLTIGASPNVTAHSSYINAMGSSGVKSAIKASISAPTVAINTLLKDSVVASGITISANEYASVIVDFNGHTLAWSSTANKAFDYSGDFHYSFDGADADGNRGTMVSNSVNLLFIYPRQSSSTGIVNEQTVTRVTNLNFVASNMGSAGTDAFLNLNSGTVVLENLDLTYTGEYYDSETASCTSAYLVNLNHDYGPRVYATVKNVKTKNTYGGDFKVYPFNLTSSACVYATGVKVENTYAAFSNSATSTLMIKDSDLSVKGSAFTAGAVDLYDTVISVESGNISTTGTVRIYATDRLATTIKTNGSALGGKYTVTEGYALIEISAGVYKLIDEDTTAKPITMPSIFANGMVFQRGKTINVFGFTEDLGAIYEVTLGDRIGYATVDENGRFYVELDPIDDPAWNLTLTIKQINTASDNSKKITNVAVGEVWVMSGQSNAQLASGYMEDIEELAYLADTYKNIRTYRITADVSLHPETIGKGKWDTKVTASDISSTSNISGISAIGYATVAKLAAELGSDVPVALIHVARGGSRIKAWLDYEALYDLSPSEAAKYDKCVENGALADSAHTTIGTSLYNNQIAPLVGYEVAGVMWYQGCSDITGSALGSEGRTYTDYFEALEQVYRRAFGNDSDLPFYVMELAPYNQDDTAGINRLSAFKAEQYAFCQALDNTYLVSNMTDGAIWGTTLFSTNGGYIHPSRKSTIGIRTADLILVHEYGFDLGEAYTNPNPISASADGGTVTITFDTEIKLFFGDKPVGFEIYDGSSWKDAIGAVSGNTITLTASGVSTALKVRYGFSAMTMELEDGTMVEGIPGRIKKDNTAETLTFLQSGYSFVATDATATIRNMDYGNVTNASGIPLPVFNLECE